MSQLIEQPRNVCALGAQQSVVAIERAAPIIHAGPGCGYKMHLGLGMFNGFQGGCYSGGAAIVSSNTGEKEVVFGGDNRLRSVIEGALQVMDADLFVVLSGCTSELVGDDAYSIVSEFRSKGVKIAYAPTAGFHGNNLLGHETVTEAIIDQIIEPRGDKEPGLVNVWSSVPYSDTFWSGNLLEIKRLLEGIGLKVNILFGPGSGGLQAWEKIPSAEYNIVVSSWVGVSTAEKLQNKFGTPYFHYPVLPIGGKETTRFLREVARFTHADKNRTEEFINSNERNYYYHFERASDFFLEFRWDLPRRFVTVSDSYYSSGITRFLTNEFGLLPLHQFITGNPPERFHEGIHALFNNIAPGISSDMTFASDGDIVKSTLRELKVRSPLILGSTFDRDIANELGGVCVSIALPITDRIVLGCSYVGYNGGLRLIEDIYSIILGSVQ